MHHPPNSPPINSISLKPRRKDVTGDCVKAFTEAHTDDICSSKLFLAQQSEMKSWMLALGFTTVCCFHLWFIEIRETSFQFSYCLETSAAE